MADQLDVPINQVQDLNTVSNFFIKKLMSF